MTNDWKIRISMKGNLYYLIVEAWLQKVLSVMTNMHREIQWSLIPGYNAVQLEAVPLYAYTDSMTKVMRTFLSNENTLSLFVQVLMLKTRPYSILEVSYVVELIDSLFCISLRNNIIPRFVSTLVRSIRAFTSSELCFSASTFAEWFL